MNEPVRLYRYDDYPTGVVLLNSFRVTKTTSCGVWIDAWGKPKFVNMQATKRYANATEEEAKAAFLARKRRQIHILQLQLDSVRDAVENMKAGRIAEEAPCFDL